MIARSTASTQSRRGAPAQRFQSSAQRTTMRPSTRASVAMVETYQAYQPQGSARYNIPSVDVEMLNKRLESKAKALIALEEQEIPTRPLVRVRFQRQVALGEAWKIVGRTPELGRFTPEVAPYMKWSTGDVWTYEGRIRRGTWTFKFVLYKPDRSYVWEEGIDRVLEIPEDAGEEDIIEMNIDNVRLPH